MLGTQYEIKASGNSPTRSANNKTTVYFIETLRKVFYTDIFFYISGQGTT